MEKSARVFAIIKYQQKVLKEKLQKEARERYQNISEKEKKSIIIF